MVNVTALIHNAATTEKVVKCNVIIEVFLLLSVLCGSCEAGYGVSALLSSCDTCHDASGI